MAVLDDPEHMTLTATATLPRPRRDPGVVVSERRQTWELVAITLLLTAVGLAAALGFGAATRDTAKIAAGFLVLIMGALVTFVAARRFSSLLLVLFAIRPVLDAAKDGGTSNLTPGVAVGFVFLVAAILWMVAQYRVGLWHPMGALSRWLIAMVIAASASVIGSDDTINSLENVLKLASGMVMFLVLEQVVLTDPKRLRGLFEGTCWVTIFSSAVALVEAALRSSGAGRVHGLFVHENDLAEYTVTVALLMLAVRPQLVGRTKRLATIAFVLSIPTLYVTYTRGAWIGFILGLLLIGLLQDRRIAAGVLVGVLAAIILVPGVTQRFSDLHDKRVVGAGDPNSFAFRERYWREIAPLANSTPITGIGLDSVEVSTPEKLLPHNTPLEVWVETGAAGSIAFIGLCAAIAVGLRRARRRLPTGLPRAWAVGGIAAAAAYGLEMTTDNLLLQALQLWYLALAVVPALALARRAEARSGKGFTGTGIVPAVSLPRAHGSRVQARLTAVAASSDGGNGPASTRMSAAAH